MTTPTLTCEHCESEIDVEKDPRCVVYDPSGATDVMCEGCRQESYRCWLESISEAHRIKRGWSA